MNDAPARGCGGGLGSCRAAGARSVEDGCGAALTPPTQGTYHATAIIEPHPHTDTVGCMGNWIRGRKRKAWPGLLHAKMLSDRSLRCCWETWGRAVWGALQGWVGGCCWKLLVFIGQDFG
jgi:hypothetical protein